jgi:hypothetical protein
MRNGDGSSDSGILGAGKPTPRPEMDSDFEPEGRMGSLVKLILVASPFLVLVLLLLLDWWFRGR